MIIREGIERAAARGAPLRIEEMPDRMRDFEVIAGVMPRIQPLPELVIRDTVQMRLLDPASVLAVDHFTHQPEILFFLLRVRPELPHEIEIQNIGAVETDAVDVKRVDPEIHCVEQISDDLGIFQVQVDEVLAAAPAVIRKSIVKGAVAVEADALIPSGIPGCFSVFLNIGKGEEFSSRVIEHAVDDHFDAAAVCTLHKLPEVLIVPKASVDDPVVRCVVAVRRRFEKRSDVNGIEAHLFDVRKPFFRQHPKPVRDLPAFIDGGRSQQSQGINMIKPCLFIPPRHFHYLQPI